MDNSKSINIRGGEPRKVIEGTTTTEMTAKEYVGYMAIKILDDLKTYMESDSKTKEKRKDILFRCKVLESLSKSL